MIEVMDDDARVVGKLCSGMKEKVAQRNIKSNMERLMGTLIKH